VPVYTSTLQTLDRFLPGGSKRGNSTGGDGQGGRGSESTSDANLLGNSRHAKLCTSLTRTSLTYLRQMAVQYGSMELYEVVLECLEQFFPSWFLTLPPAQQLQMNYSDPKWVGAAFWLCAMAKNMNATPEEIAGKTTDKAPKKIGGRGGKELKELIMTAVEHKVQQKDLETTIRLIEQYAQQYLVSLKKIKGGSTSTVSAPSTPRKRKTSSTSGDLGVDIVIPTRGGTEAQRLLQLKQQQQQQQSTASNNPFMDPTVSPDDWELRRARALRDPAAGATTTTTTQGRSTKRTISNVSQMSLVSDGEDEEGSKQNATARPSRPSKRTKVESTAEDSQSSTTAISSSGIMKPKKGSVRKDLQTTAANQRGRRRTGGVYNMVRSLRRTFRKQECLCLCLCLHLC